MDVVVNKDNMMDVSLLPGMDSIPKNTNNLQGLSVPFNEDEEMKGVELKSSQTVVNEAPSSVQFSKASDSRINRPEQIKTTTVESTQSQQADNSSGGGGGGQFFSISSCISCIIIFLIASAIAYYLYSNPDKLDKLMTKLPSKLQVKLPIKK